MIDQQPCIYILAPVHNRYAITKRFVDCLTAQSYTNWHLVLVDDGSTDGTGDMVRARIPGATILRGDGNWWWAGSLEQGYRWLCGQPTRPHDIVLIINDDTEFSQDFLAEAARALEPRCLLLAQLYDLADGKYCEAGVHWDWRRLACWGVKDQDSINCFSTRGLFLRVDDMKEIGGFYPTILPHYLSDYEYTIRAYRKGFQLRTDPRVFVHYDDTSTGIRELPPAPLGKVLRTALSIRSTDNPVYWSSFVLLASPWRFKLSNLMLVWRRFVSNVVKTNLKYRSAAK